MRPSAVSSVSCASPGPRPTIERRGFECGGPLARLRLKRLLSNSSIKAEAPDKYYLDEVAYAELRKTRRRRALMVLGLVVVGTFAAWALGIVRF